MESHQDQEKMRADLDPERCLLRVVLHPAETLANSLLNNRFVPSADQSGRPVEESYFNFC